VPSESVPITLQRFLDSALVQARRTPPQQAHHDMGQWLKTLRHTLPYPTLWEPSRELLRLVLKSLNATGRIADVIEWLEIGIEQSQSRHDPETAATLQLQLGRERIHQGDNPAAAVLLREGVAYFESTNRVYPPALNALAYFSINTAQWAEAEAWVKRALAVLPENEWAERAQSYRNLGIIAQRKGNLEQALDYFQESLRLWQLEENPRFVAFGLVNLATAMRPLRRYKEAESHYLQAITLFEAVGDPLHRALAQNNLGNVYLKWEQWDAAIEQYHAAEQILAQSLYRVPLALLYNNWGMAYAGAGQWKRAVRAYQQSIALHIIHGNLQMCANDRDNLGLALMELERYDEAIETFHAALEDLQSKDIPATVTLREEIYLHLAEAEQHKAMH